MLARRLTAALGTAVLLASLGVVAVSADDPLDPAHNVALPCEALGTPGLAPRSAKDIAHLANVCGFVGTDVEFQSRVLADGSVGDYAFVGTMGAGLRIFDVTDPAHPFEAGRYADPGWQGDVQVRGDIAVVSFDPIASTAPTLSACLQAKALETGTRTSGGIDIVRLQFDPGAGTFTTKLLGCVAGNPNGGAHNSTLHPFGEWLAMSNPRGQGSVDVVDLRGAPTLRFRIVQDATLANVNCTALKPPARCISNGRAGTWSPHDVSFSADGNTMHVAAVGNDTVIVDVSSVLAGAVATISVVPSDRNADGNIANDPHDISISHQSDVSADGKILVITDERGGGVGETRCNEDANGIIGGAHFWALAPVEGLPQTTDATPATPRRIGAWFYPNPLLAVDALDAVLASLGRTERGCTIHVLRNGGNGTAGPGAIAPGFDGVSRLPTRQFATAHYGAGVWHVDFSAAPTDGDGTPEQARTTWGNTRGWNVMPGADTWSGKEYKGFIYAGDMARGFDVYAFAKCDGLGCLVVPTNTPGKASGGGKAEGELAEFTVLRGTAVGAVARFGFSVSYVTGAIAPSGDLSFRDLTTGKDVKATAIDSFAVLGTKATFSGRATVNGTPGVKFFVEVEDLGEPGGADSFRIALADGYGAAGVVQKGNIQVSSGP